MIDLEDENIEKMINFKGENTAQKIEILRKIINWLWHEMEYGRVNNNNLILTNETSKLKTPLSIAFVKMVENGDIDEVTASENLDMFIEWDEKSTFKAGNIRRRNGMLVQCLQDHTGQVGWEPEKTPALWKQFSINENGIPDWSQPISSADAYMLNAETMHNGYVWVSDYDNNVWEPGVFGWHIKCEEQIPQIPESTSSDTL